MYKLAAVILVVSAAVTCAPGRTTEDLDTILDAVFGSSTPAQPTSKPTRNTEDFDTILDAVFGSSTTAQPTSKPTRTTEDLDTILDAVFGSSTPAQPTSKLSASDEVKECAVRGKKGTCVSYYLCPEATGNEPIDLIQVPEEEDCPHYLEVCCLAPKTLDVVKDST